MRNKRILVAIIFALTTLLSGCSDGSAASYDDGYDRGYEEGYESGFDAGKDAGYESGYSDGMYEGEYCYEDYIYGVLAVIDEAISDPGTTQKMFDLCDDAGYYPSKLLGMYCYDTNTHIIHLCDSDCVEQQKEKSIVPFVTYAGNVDSFDVFDSIEGIEGLIEENEYLSKLNLTRCPICIDSVSESDTSSYGEDIVYSIENDTAQKSSDKDKGFDYSAVPLKQVESSFIDAVGYSEEYRVLLIKMNGSYLYRYNDVDVSVYRDFINADSLGTYFNANIKGQYDYERIY